MLGKIFNRAWRDRHRWKVVLGITNDASDHYQSRVNQWVQTDTAGGVVHVDLPAITPENAGASIGVVNMSTGTTSTVRVNTTGSDTVDENAAFFDIISDLQTGLVVSDGVSNWMKYSGI